jgi:signal transduction histidine kinase
MLDNTTSGFPLRILNLAAYLTMAAMGIAAIAAMPSSEIRLLALGLLIAFGVLFHVTVDAAMHNRQRGEFVWLGLQTILVGTLSILDTTFGSTNNYLSMLFFITSAEVMIILPQKTGVFWIVIFAAVSAAVFVYGAGIANGLRSAVIYGAGYFFFGAFASALRQVQTAHKTSAALLEELQIAHDHLRRYADQVERMAALEERNRLAREVHDSLGHRLTVAAVQLEGAQRLISKDPGRAASIVETVRQQVREALSDLRRTVAALRQPDQMDIALPQAIEQLAASFGQATGLTVHRNIPQELDLSPAYRLTLYRATQEGLTNVQRHAQAKDVWLELVCEPNMVTLTVGDNGIGCSDATQSTGFGLIGLAERAAVLGGKLTIGDRSEGGTQLTLSLPIVILSKGKDD